MLVEVVRVSRASFIHIPFWKMLTFILFYRHVFLSTALDVMPSILSKRRGRRRRKNVYSRFCDKNYSLLQQKGFPCMLRESLAIPAKSSFAEVLEILFKNSRYLRQIMEEGYMIRQSLLYKSVVILMHAFYAV